VIDGRMAIFVEVVRFAGRGPQTYHSCSGFV
jgi:hypothetical protein